MGAAGSDTELPWAEVIDKLHGFVARRVSDPADAADITSEVIERVHRRSDQLLADDRFTAWVLAVARNAVIDHYRASARRREHPQAEVGDDRVVEQFDADPSADSTRVELAACVLPLLAELPVHYRQAITLTEFDGLSQVEAAERLSMSLSGLKSRVQRARRMLRAGFEACCDITVDARGAPVWFEPRGGRRTQPGNAREEAVPGGEPRPAEMLGSGSTGSAPPAGRDESPWSA